MKKTVYFFALCLLFFSCSEKEKPIVMDLSTINFGGTWKLVESYVSPGGETSWEPVEDGLEYTFDGDGSFTATWEVCNSGSYSFQDETLVLNCDSEDGRNESYRLVSYNDKEMILSYAGCIEACKYKYLKIE